MSDKNPDPQSVLKNQKMAFPLADPGLEPLAVASLCGPAPPALLRPCSYMPRVLAQWLQGARPREGLAQSLESRGRQKPACPPTVPLREALRLWLWHPLLCGPTLGSSSVPGPARPPPIFAPILSVAVTSYPPPTPDSYITS